MSSVSQSTPPPLSPQAIPKHQDGSGDKWVSFILMVQGTSDCCKLCAEWCNVVQAQCFCLFQMLPESLIMTTCTSVSCLFLFTVCFFPEQSCCTSTHTLTFSFSSNKIKVEDHISKHFEGGFPPALHFCCSLSCSLWFLVFSTWSTVANLSGEEQTSPFSTCSFISNDGPFWISHLLNWSRCTRFMVVFEVYW